MHGLINRSIQCFLRDTYGLVVWRQVAHAAGLGFDSFEPLLTYDASLTEAVIETAARVLRRPRETVLEDLGTYLVSHPNLERLRRLLRFGGVTFRDFLHSLEDVPERSHLALPDLDLPELRLEDLGEGIYRLHCSAMISGVGHVIVGLLRAMADDYGALVLLDHEGCHDDTEVISVQLLLCACATGEVSDVPPLFHHQRAGFGQADADERGRQSRWHHCRDRTNPGQSGDAPFAGGRVV